MKTIARYILLLATAIAGHLYGQPTSSMVLNTVYGPPNSFFTYPHYNGFWRPDTVNWGPDTAVIAVIVNASTYTYDLELWDPATGKTALIGQQTFLAGTYFWDVASNGKCVVTDSNSRLMLWDLNTNTTSVLWSSSTDRVTGQSITADGSKVAFSTQLIGSNGLDCTLQSVDVATGVSQVLVHKGNFNLNHVAFSPFDNNWITHSHEGDPTVVRDRMWGWNATSAPSPDGTNIFTDASPLLLQNDHERPMFNKGGSVVVSYGGSFAGSGLWENDFDSTYRKVSNNQLGYNANHCNISRDGAWMVIDTTNVSGVSQIIAVNVATGLWQQLYTTSINNHPWHPHPHISPDGNWILFNDYNQQKVVAIQIDQTQLSTFLSGSATIPPAPTGLTANPPSTSQVDLFWRASASAATYNVLRSTTSGGPYTTIATGITTKSQGGVLYSDTGRSAGTAYYYVVQAVNSAGTSSNSAQASATTPPSGTAAAPTALTAAMVSSSQINLSWAASSGATSYNVLRATTSGGPYTLVSGSVLSTSYSDTTLTGATPYYYVVQAVNGSGTSGNSNQGSATTPATGTALAPTGLTATAASTSQINLSWTASSGATFYNVLRATVSGGPYSLIAEDQTTTSYSDSGLGAGMTFYYVVQAGNGSGTSPDSAEASATTQGIALNSWITGVTLGSTLRNDLNNWVGSRLTIGASPVTVRALGRWVVSGNTGSHTVKLVNQSDGTDVPGGSVTVNTSGAPAGSFVYASLASPVTLSANTTYYLVSQETAGGDQYYNYSSVTVTTTSVSSADKAVRFDGTTWYAAGNLPNMYGPVNFEY